jgi:hypothetical protein
MIDRFALSIAVIGLVFILVRAIMLERARRARKLDDTGVNRS